MCQNAVETLMAATMYGRAEKQDATDSLRALSTPRLNVAETIPDSIRSNWYRLKQSGLPVKAFGELVSAASSPDRVSGRGKRPLSPKSLENFLLFWEAVANHAAEPVLSIAPSGYIVAEWYNDSEHSLVVMTDGDDKLFFSLFDEGRPVEGFENTASTTNVINMFLARRQNPFLWSDA
jgi:hypothetical protein